MIQSYDFGLFYYCKAGARFATCPRRLLFGLLVLFACFFGVLV